MENETNDDIVRITLYNIVAIIILEIMTYSQIYNIIQGEWIGKWEKQLQCNRNNNRRRRVHALLTD